MSTSIHSHPRQAAQATPRLAGRLARVMPILQWLPRYKRADFGGDLGAGLTTAVMLIPQAMAYALLAGLPPVMGLYAAVAPLVAYAVFGSSRQLAVGPAAMVSLLVASGVGALAEAGSGAYISLAITTALLVGAVQIAMGVARLGFLVNFLSQPVISGFGSAAALIIGVSQLKHVLGLRVPRGQQVLAVMQHTLSQLDQVNLPTLAIGGVSIVALVALKRVAPRFPRALVVVVGATVAVAVLRLDEAGVAIVGAVPAGLPTPGVPRVTVDRVVALLPTAATIALVGFMQSIGVAKAFARSRGYGIEPNQELIGLGFANVASAFFGAFPVTGGFARTAVNAQAGAKTGVAGMITAVVIAITLLFLTSWLHYLPTAVLAALIMTAVAGLFEWQEMRRLWSADRRDFVLLGLTFVATLSFGIERGILLGVVASMLWFVVETTQPHTAELGRLPGSHVWRNLERHADAEPVPGIVAVRIDAPLYYGNVSFMKATLERLIDANPGTHDLIMDFSPVRTLDSSAASALAQLRDELAARGVTLHLATVRGPVRDTLQRVQLDTHIGAQRTHECVNDAVRCIQKAENTAS